MLRWLFRLLRQGQRPAAGIARQPALPARPVRAGRLRISTTVEDFEAHVRRTTEDRG